MPLKVSTHSARNGEKKQIVFFWANVFIEWIEVVSLMVHILTKMHGLVFQIEADPRKGRHPSSLSPRAKTTAKDARRARMFGRAEQTDARSSKES